MVVRKSFKQTALSGSRFSKPPALPEVTHFIGIVINFGRFSLAAQVARHMKKTAIGAQRLMALSFVPGVDFSNHRNCWKFS